MKMEISMQKRYLPEKRLAADANTSSFAEEESFLNRWTMGWAMKTWS
jgi:hypothetical protein